MILHPVIANSIDDASGGTRWDRVLGQGEIRDVSRLVPPLNYVQSIAITHSKN